MGKTRRSADECLALVRSGKTIDKCIQLIQEAYGISHVAYHLGQKSVDTYENPYVKTTYPVEWVGQYLLKNYINVDPVAIAGYTIDTPTLWSDLDWSSPEALEFRKDADRYDIPYNGLLVPISDKHQRKAIVNFASNVSNAEWSEILSDYKKALIETAGIIHELAIQDLFGDSDDIPTLTRRELQCLHFAALGMDAGEIAEQLLLSDHTVRDYCKSARLKLNCSNLAQAVHKATKLRLIDPKI